MDKYQENKEKLMESIGEVKGESTREFQDSVK
jgi:hypothetical protein